jgi:hypothetical protein
MTDPEIVIKDEAKLSKDHKIPPGSSSSSKRKRKRPKTSSSPSKGDNSNQKRQNKPESSILNGLTVSVSTLEVKGESHSDADASFRAVSDLCASLGASVSSQVCKRVNLLVCTPSAVDNATQRVRKAYKKKIPLVDMQWLVECQKQRCKLDIDEFRLDEKAQKAIESRANKRNNPKDFPNESRELDKEENLPEAGWSEPVSLGCCCVCHENGSEADCKWCTDACIVK